jgi:hypothetical protein
LVLLYGVYPEVSSVGSARYYGPADWSVNSYNNIAEEPDNFIEPDEEMMVNTTGCFVRSLEGIGVILIENDYMI